MIIAISTFNVLLAVAFLLFLYALVDLSNRVYGNIISMFISAYILWYLGTAIKVGVVGDSTGTYTSASMEMLLWFIATAAFVYAVLLSIEAWFEWQRQKELMKKGVDE